MATALDLLMSAKEDVNLLSEQSDICTIDAKTRIIFVPSTIVVGGVQSDKNAERIKFSCPKIVGDNLDLSKFSVRINFENVSSVDFNVSIKDQYICDDVAVDGENVTFSWLIGRNAARYMGTVRFIVCAVKTDSDSNISVEWNTTIAEVPVLEGIEIDQPQIGQEEKDVINQLLELTKNTSAEAVQNVNSAKEQAIKNIQSVSQPDTTLTIEGGLAEAKATGEAIGSLKEDLAQVSESIGEVSKVVKNNLEYNYTGLIPKFVPYDMTTGHEYFFSNKSGNIASVSVSETDGGTLTPVNTNFLPNANTSFIADKEYHYIKVFVQNGGILSVVDKGTLTETFDAVSKLSANNERRINGISEANKEIYTSGNSKVDLDKYVGMTFAEFRGVESSPSVMFDDSTLIDNEEYSWIVQCSSNNSVQYGSNITLSIGIFDGTDTEWLVNNVISGNVIKHERLSKANIIKFNTTGVWINAVDSQTITYINIYKKADGNHYAEYIKKIKNDSVNWWSGKNGDSLGDSLTGQGFFQTWTRRYFNLNKFSNHGIGGTKLSGSANQYGDSMWMDSRINALDADADFITVLGGQNDGDVPIGDVSLSNHDVNTFAGALNVIISKLYYKYLALDSGYYSDINYSDITKVANPHNIIIIPCTPFFVPNTTQNLNEKADAVREIAKLWSLNVADYRAKSQSSMPLRNVYWGTDTTHPQENFYKERISPILIGIMEELKPIDWDKVVYGS